MAATSVSALHRLPRYDPRQANDQVRARRGSSTARPCRRNFVSPHRHREENAKQAIRDKLIDHKQYIARYGDDMPEITGWRWGQEAASAGARSTEADNV